MLHGEVVEALRQEAAPSGAGAEVEAHGLSLSTESGERRRLTPAEKAKALRLVGRLLSAADAPFALEGKGEWEQVVHVAQKLKDRALLSAVERVIDEGGCFLSKGVDGSLRNGDGWQYWNVDFPMREGERRWMQTLIVPIDLARFPDVADRRVRLAAIRDQQRADEVLVWNCRPFEERRELVEQARRAREECSVVEGQMSSVGDSEAKARLGLRQRELLTIMSRVPRKCDPQTLEASP
ncbi:MAG: hypothetical protein H6838_08650 [Planctomycetes bacterium]|nr:hypothetical protein [Planctomycetota bacterium]MCB9885548.1 hypothetical protein [Planctomycetota bacterium]